MKPDLEDIPAAGSTGLRVLEAKFEGEREIAKNFRAAAKDEFEIFKESLTREIRLAKESTDKELVHLNELRKEVTTDRGLFVRIDKYGADMMARDAKVESIEKAANLKAESVEQRLGGRIDPIEKWQAGLVAAGLPAEVASQGMRIKAMEDWRNKLLGIGVMIALFAGLVGALLMRLMSGVFGK